jgi:Xaa-Pro aminopeptidase
MTPVTTSPLPKAEFSARRARIFTAIGADSLALIQGAPPVRAFQLFRQTNEFHYCCGIEIPQAYLLLDGRDHCARLYIPSRPEGRHDEFGPPAAEDAEQIMASSGLDEVLPVEALQGALSGASALYTPHAPAEAMWTSRDVLQHSDRLIAADPWDGQSTREQRFIGLLRERCPSMEIRDLTPILDSLRAVKSGDELALMRISGRLSAAAVTEAMRATAPGVGENDLLAIAQFLFAAGGARGEGYRSIIASGDNAWDGHYGRDCSKMRDGDLVLMDCAPGYEQYTSDIGRMWPVNGTFSPWQRELYGFVVHYNRALLRRIRPGLMAEDIQREAAEEMRAFVESTKWSKATYADSARRALDFRAHLSHPVGMAVHDNGGYWSEPLKPGAVFSVDPMMWVPEERLYIRCEDTVAVTEEGIENLTGAAPLDPDEIEAEMRKECRFPLVLQT